MTIPRVAEAPAGYARVTALRFGAQGRAATPIDAYHPLPVRGATVAAAAATPLAGATSATGVEGQFAPELARPIVLTHSGSWMGSVQLLRSVDGGAT